MRCQKWICCVYCTQCTNDFFHWHVHLVVSHVWYFFSFHHDSNTGKMDERWEKNIQWLFLNTIKRMRMREQASESEKKWGEISCSACVCVCVPCMQRTYAQKRRYIYDELVFTSIAFFRYSFVNVCALVREATKSESSMRKKNGCKHTYKHICMHRDREN